jgi:anti-sigma regulatory factor (Ser/Thr protein kinase)
MISTAIKTDPMIAFVLPGIAESAGVARCHVRVALDYLGLGDYADDAAVITSELVANAVQHANMDSTETLR